MIIAAPLFASAATLTRSLDVGMSGPDVSTLQTFLATDVTIYPQGLVTGYFGFLTKSAVSNYQSRNGIDTVGRVGPITLASINAQMNGDTSAAIISNVGVTVQSNSAVLHWYTNEPTHGLVYFSASPMAESETLTDATIQGSTAMTDSGLRNQQDVMLSGLQSNTTYHYVIYTKDAAGNVQITDQTTFRTL